MTADIVTGDWAHYWRAADEPLEAMHAHFERHVYHRHSHETYSLGVTDVGAQSFTCRGAAYTSAAGMVMAFNPDDPHDGQATDGFGFTYRMIHIGPELVSAVLADAAGRPVGLPLFAEPVLSDPELAARLRDLHGADVLIYYIQRKTGKPINSADHIKFWAEWIHDNNGRLKQASKLQGVG